MTQAWERSARLFAEAQEVLVGGVNSPVRAFGGVGASHPLFMARGAGAYIWDADGNRYLDLVLSWGPLIVGHAHPEVLEAVSRAAARGTSFGAPTEWETHLARHIRAHLPSMEKLRFVNSGTEAVMSAIRLARGYTGRHRLVKFDGCYHGHVDALLVRAGSGALTLGVPDSPGIPPAVAGDTLVLPYNDLDAVSAAFADGGETVAAVIVEPVAGNMGVIPPEPGFLKGLRRLTADHGALLIFDEVITGFRVAAGGAQGLYGVRPDLTCLGKIIGGGLPVGAYGGAAQVMARLAPEGPVYQAGTLAGNPVAMAAGSATLELLLAGERLPRLIARTERTAIAIRERFAAAGVPVTVNQVGAMFSLFFTEGPVRRREDVARADAEGFRRWFHALLDAGVYVAPSPYEASFLSLAHGEEQLDELLTAVAAAAEVAGRISR